MGPIPAWARSRHDRAFSTEVHHAEKFTTRAQPDPIESNAVPDQRRCLTVYERGSFGVLSDSSQHAPFGRAQKLITNDQNIGKTESGHNFAQPEGRKKVFE
jgi:hypothetical protein